MGTNQPARAALAQAGRVLKSAVRPRGTYTTSRHGAPTAEAVSPPARVVVTPEDARDAQVEFFVTHLHSRPNKRGKPYSPETIKAYRDAAVSLGRYLYAIDFTGGFDAVDVKTLNDYLRDYRAANGQGGTVTKQSNLRVFFAYLVREYDAPAVYNHPDRHRYAREEDNVPILSDGFLDDLLKAVSGKDFMSVRDNAIIRMLFTGPRRAEISALHVEDLDLRGALKTATTGRIKNRAGRPVPLPPNTVNALNRWLRARAAHSSGPSPVSGPLWISCKRGSALGDTGIYLMLRRRAVQAGYDPSTVHPHLFRHTAAHQFLADGGSEGDAMQIFGWKDSEMPKRYGASAAQERALLYAARTGFGDR